MNGPVVLYQLDTYEPAAVREAICQTFGLLGGLNAFVKAGQYVLIKPNLISSRPQSQTNPVVIVELAKLVKEAGCRVAVADSPAWGSITSCARKSGLLTLAGQSDIPIFEFRDPVKTDNPAGLIHKKLTVSRQALEADVVINVPKLKTHQQLKLTAAIKNMFGVVPGKRKAWWHFTAGRDHHFAYMLIDTYRLMKPALTIIDAVEAMEGPGPIRGDLRPLGALVASQDPFAAELVACQLVGCDPKSLTLIQAGWNLGLSPERVEQVEVVGTRPEQLRVDDFDFPSLIPLRFSLPRVVKSTAKQAWLLCQGKLGRR